MSARELGAATQPRAAFFVAPRTLELRPLSREPLAPDAVRVKTELSAISSGTELLFYRGELEAGVPVDATLPWAGTLSYPLRYGYAAVGSIVEQGSGIPKRVIGQRMFGFQPHQEEFVERYANLLPLPAALPNERAVFWPNMETAVSFMMDGAPLIGEQAAVLGQGVVGQLLAAILVRSAVENTLLIDSRADRLEHSRALCGADARAEWRERVEPAHHGGCDLVYELTGDPRALDAAQDLARYEGRIIIGSWYGSRRAPVDFGTRAHRNRNQFLFSQVSRIDSRHAARFDSARRLGVARGWLERLPLESLVTHRVPFERIADAYQLLDERREAACQVLITYDGS
jgi:2-desacetyl-2-hydroxyethyl bacteriochlorophyllide A dehydrogenase